MAASTEKTSGSPSLRLATFFPIVQSIRGYTRTDFGSDLFAGIITAILLVPQGIAYAMLAGLPPQVGLYASILPPILYALLGTSRTLSTGPVSIAAIMIASALSAPEIAGHGNPVGNAMVLAAECGIILFLMSLFRMGMLVNFISHPVLTGFTSGAAVLIILSQLPHLLGYEKVSCGLDLYCYQQAASTVNIVTAIVGLSSIIGLWLFAGPLVSLLTHMGLNKTLITALSKSGPLLVVLLGGLAVAILGLDISAGVKTVGAVPAGLPNIGFSVLSMDTWQLLLPSAAFIALIAYVESVAIAKVTASLRRQRINPNQELIALGGANLAAALSGGMPVAGGFSRTMVNFAAGAVSQVATLIAAGLLAIAVVFMTDWFAGILNVSLAAVILLAILPLVKFKAMLKTWRYDRGEGVAELATFIGVLALGIEEGLGLGIVLTLLCYLWRTSRPHIAVVGQLPGTEHFRNIERHVVNTWSGLLMIRVDENLTFANVAYIEDFIQNEVAMRPEVRNLVLIFTSVSHIDTTAVEALENLINSLRSNQVTLSLAEVKGPVMDQLKQTEILQALSPGKVFLSTSNVVDELSIAREG